MLVIPNKSVFNVKILDQTQTWIIMSGSTDPQFKITVNGTNIKVQYLVKLRK